MPFDRHLCVESVCFFSRNNMWISESQRVEWSYHFLGLKELSDPIHFLGSNELSDPIHCLCVCWPQTVLHHWWILMHTAHNLTSHPGRSTLCLKTVTQSVPGGWADTEVWDMAYPGWPPSNWLVLPPACWARNKNWETPDLYCIMGKLCNALCAHINVGNFSAFQRPLAVPKCLL